MLLAQCIWDNILEVKKKSVLCWLLIFVFHAGSFFVAGNERPSDNLRKTPAAYVHILVPKTMHDIEKRMSVSVEKSELNRKWFSCPINTYMFLKIPT